MLFCFTQRFFRRNDASFQIDAWSQSGIVLAREVYVRLILQMFEKRYPIWVITHNVLQQQVFFLIVIGLFIA
jgi:hypothetical protein